MINWTSIKQSGSDLHVFHLAFEHADDILNTSDFWLLHLTVTCPNVANCGHFMFLAELVKLTVTFADVDRFYWNLMICLRLDVTLLVENLLKSDVVCRSYQNVYSGLLFSQTHCCCNCCMECRQGNATKLTQQMSAAPKQCHYFTLWIKRSSCRTIKTHNVITDNCKKIRPEYQLFDSTSERRLQTFKGCSYRKITMSELKAVLEMTTARHGLKDGDATDAQLQQWRRDPAWPTRFRCDFWGRRDQWCAFFVHLLLQ